MVVVIGGGAVGLAIAWRLSRRGAPVTLVDPAPGQGASHAAGGMLAPVSELHHGEERLLELNLESNRCWPAFVDELEKASGVECCYRTEGTMSVALDAGDRAALSDLADHQRRLGLAVQRLSGRECRRVESLLSPDVTAGLRVDEDKSVDNRRFVAALLEACRRGGVLLVLDRATAVTAAGGRVSGVRLTSGDVLAADTVVLAAGVATPDVAGVPTAEVPVRPVKGVILRLRVPAHLAPLLTRTVRGLVGGHPVYLVPRVEGELVVGATSSEQSDTIVSAGAVYRLLRDARAVVPAVDEFELVEAIARLRPGTPDNAPILGPTSLPGLVVATGHYRNGILLTPVTADAMVSLVLDGSLPPVAEPFGPHRFRRTPQEVLT